MVRTLLVIGTGLIGTSVALAARRAGVAVHLSDRDPAAARIAESLGAGLAEMPRHAVDLTVLAVPPAAVGPVLRDCQARRLSHSYTDVASVKGETERAALRLAPDPAAYVGGHPMAGRERSGPMAASADLFEGRAWVLTPHPRAGAAAIEHATGLALLCGGIPIRSDSSRHDADTALTSHVPHLMASLTAARLRDGAPGIERLAGRGVRDVTRIAAGDPVLWTDIVRSNAPAVAAVLREVRADLTRLLEAVESLSGAGPVDRAAAERAIADLLERGVAGERRARTPGGSRAGDREWFRVVVGRRPGALGALLRTSAPHGVTPDDVRAACDGDDVVVHLPVPIASAGAVRRALAAAGWTVHSEGRDS